ncbi:MAG: OmpH family outer membrane protein [Candidatus Omnitrophica bacterium]|nr:OmpH family outer membrane protein [Candidatus Omnitrophota bacterium]
MKKVIGLFLAMILALSLTTVSYAQSSLRIAYVNLSRVFDEYSKTSNYDQTLEKKSTEYQKERNKKLEKIQEAERKLVLLKEEEKEKLKIEIDKNKNDLIEFDREKQTDLRKERDEKIREILLEIEEVVKVYAEKEKYDIILNDRVLIYGSKELEITEKVLDILNKKN